MPWLPDFVSAAELVRQQYRLAGQVDPVAQYIVGLTRGDTRAVEDAWPGEVVIYDPRAGEIRGHRQLRQFIKDSRSMLAEHDPRIETVACTVAGNRAVVELLVRLTYGAREVVWPVAIVADSRDDRSIAFRSYFSQRAIDGLPHIRSPILPPGRVHPGDVVGHYQAALAAGDADAVVNTFAADGYYREAIGPQHTYRGLAELRRYFHTCLPARGIGLQHCAVTDDGVRCALEYNCVRWGTEEMEPQAGIAVYERGADGVLAAARAYDDVQPPDPGGGPG